MAMCRAMQFAALMVLALMIPASGPCTGQESAPVSFQLQLVTAHSGFDGKTCWVHARAGAIPGQRHGFTACRDDDAEAVAERFRRVLRVERNTIGGQRADMVEAGRARIVCQTDNGSICRKTPDRSVDRSRTPAAR